MKSLIVLMLFLSLACGCASTNQPAVTKLERKSEDIVVTVGTEGKLNTSNFRFDESDLAKFANEVGDQRVVLTGNPFMQLTVLMATRDRFKAAGVKHVVIEQLNSGAP